VKRLKRGARWLLIAIGLLIAGLAAIVLIFALLARRRTAELQPWHRIELAEEFRAGGGVDTFEAYRALEGRLQAELRRELLDDPSRADTYSLGRYTPGSVPARLALGTPFNASFELEPDGEPRGAALLVHGLSDSPYSMRAVAGILREQGFYVLVLRLPGHGTIPAGLLEVDWKDWYAAVEIAARHVAARAGQLPFYVGGYSTGAALTALYSLRMLEDSELPKPTRLVVLSAAIGIPSSARLTRILASLAFLPGLEQSRWLDVAPEYDPYKYNSFPVNAARQIYDLTIELAAELESARARGALPGMPRVLAFQSLVDATVTARDVALRLMGPLTPNQHELVVFDVNRREGLEALVAPGLRSDLELLRATPDLPFRLVVVGNSSPDSDDIELVLREVGVADERRLSLGLVWPRGVLSLGHVALPFEPNDPVYGLTPDSAGELDYPLGALGVRGESGTLVVGLGTLARMRCNPFFEVVRARLIDAVQTDLKGSLSR
jgi:alpha-beta hydrolase superfamily lysophospholipase